MQRIRTGWTSYIDSTRRHVAGGSWPNPGGPESALLVVAQTGLEELDVDLAAIIA